MFSLSETPLPIFIHLLNNSIIYSYEDVPLDFCGNTFFVEVIESLKSSGQLVSAVSTFIGNLFFGEENEDSLL